MSELDEIGRNIIKLLQCVAGAFGLSLMELTAIAMREEMLMEMVYDARAKAGMVK